MIWYCVSWENQNEWKGTWLLWKMMMKWVCGWTCLCVFHTITLWIWNNIKMFVFIKYHSVDTSRKCWESSLNTHTNQFSNNHSCFNGCHVCLNIDSTSSVLLFLWINIIHWCTNKLCCYHCCSNTHTNTQHNHEGWNSSINIRLE